MVIGRKLFHSGILTQYSGCFCCFNNNMFAYLISTKTLRIFMFLLSCLPRTVFKKGNIEIDYYEKYHCLHLSWSGQIDKEEYKNLMLQMLDFTQKLKVQFWIFDAREEDNFKFFDPEWSTQFLTRELSKHPIKKIARIASGNSNNETQLSS